MTASQRALVALRATRDFTTPVPRHDRYVIDAADERRAIRVAADFIRRRASSLKVREFFGSWKVIAIGISPTVTGLKDPSNINSSAEYAHSYELYGFLQQFALPFVTETVLFVSLVHWAVSLQLLVQLENNAATLVTQSDWTLRVCLAVLFSTNVRLHLRL
ncbi:hypothetical protein PENSPDRAFT_734350 [Peniophora sp. CONT]|nr:hypothetical protein PENSPDRAFT_734350 [Peniophora sp. CONT]